MAILNQNGINFNNINFNDFTAVSSVVSRDTAGKIAAGKGSYVTNAVSIDWNGMQLGDEHVINTTGELASYISTASTAAANASSEITKIRTDLSSNYITTSEADNKYQPKGNYLPLTGGTITESGEIQDKPTPDTMSIYTKITPGTIQFGDISNEKTLSNYINIDTISKNGSKSEINLSYNIANPKVTYDCIITPDDVVLKVDNAEVKKLSEVCQGGATVTDDDTARWNAATTTINNHSSDNSKHISDDERRAWNAKANSSELTNYQPKGNYIKYSESSTLTISYDNISNWNDAYNGINNKADSSELANYLPLTGGIIKGNYEGGVAPVSAKTIGIHPDKIELTNGIDSVQKNVNITVNGISVKSSVPHMTSGSSTLETTYCTITPDDVIIKNNDVVINGLSFLLNKITNLEKRIDALESKTGGTIIKDPTQQVPSTGHETEVVTP